LVNLFPNYRIMKRPLLEPCCYASISVYITLWARQTQHDTVFTSKSKELWGTYQICCFGLASFPLVLLTIDMIACISHGKSKRILCFLALGLTSLCDGFCCFCSLPFPLLASDVPLPFSLWSLDLCDFCIVTYSEDQINYYRKILICSKKALLCMFYLYDAEAFSDGASPSVLLFQKLIFPDWLYHHLLTRVRQ